MRWLEQHFLHVESVTKRFGESLVLDNLSFPVKENEFLTLLGPSGCGKTTTLRIIGGFEQATSGRVWFEGTDITDLPPHKRHINTVFQSYALFGHLNVFENVAFGLRIRKLPAEQIRKKVRQMLEVVNLPDIEHRRIQSLSGGQQQRVAIARAMVNEPRLLLLDEPLGALDLKLRVGMQLELKRIQRRLGITFIYVTHDQEEALSMSDTVIVMHNGYIQQMGSPVDVYNEPANAFVADFIGESNIVPGIMHADFDVEFAQRRFECTDRGFGAGEAVDVVVRPEDIDITTVERGMLSGVVESVIFRGVHWEMLVRTDYHQWLVHSTDLSAVGTHIGLSIDPDAIHVMHRSEV